MKATLFHKLIASLLLCSLLLLSACKNGGDKKETAPQEPESAASSAETTETTAEETAEEAQTTEEAADEAPFFLKISSSVTVDRGSTFDLHRHISYADDLDPEVDLLVEGEVDTALIGDYPLTLTLTDDAGNTVTQSMTVKVAEPVPQTPKTSETPKSFAVFSQRYKRDDTMVGIDVSKWQGNIDFNKVAAAGCEFVIIRIGGYSDGVFTDKYYKSNIKNAKKAGLKVGVYWYSEQDGAEAVRRDADYLYSLLDGEALDFPIFFDWEDYGDFENYKMSLKDLNEMFLAFRAEAEARGYKASLYNSKYYLGLLWNDAVKEGGVWLAHYTDQTSYEGEYFLWQQGYGRIDGIGGDVDVDVLYPARLWGDDSDA